MLNDTQRLHLQEMIKANNTEDTTNAIREVRHSSIIHSEVQELVNLKQKYSRLSKTNPQQFDDMCVKRCNFLFNNYTEIFNKVKKDEWIDDYYLQCAAYAMAHNTVYGTNISQGVILLCTKDNIFQRFMVDGERFKNYQNQFMKKVEQFYSQRFAN